MATKDYYDVLEISLNANHEVIKKQYHFLLHAWHPDKFPDPDQKSRANQKTKEINEAYAVLGDPGKRAEYDKQRSAQPFNSSSKATDQSQYNPTQSDGNRKGTQQTENDELRRRVEEAERYQAMQRKKEQAETARRALEEQRRRRQRRSLLFTICMVFIAGFVLIKQDLLKSFFGTSSAQFTPSAIAFNPTSTPEQKPVLPTNTVTPLPSATIPEPTQTAKPTDVQLVDQGKNYKIELVPSDKPMVLISFNMPEQIDLSQQQFTLTPIVKDIAGSWQYRHDQYDITVHFDPDKGFFADKQQPAAGGDFSELVPGNYLLSRLDVGSSSANFLGGYWGNTRIPSTSGFGDPGIQGLVVPVKEKSTTRVAISLSELQVGVLNGNGTRAQTEVSVTVYCQTKDIAGQSIYDDECGRHGGGKDYPSRARTDSTGLYTLLLGPGTYILHIDAGWNTKEYKQNDIQLTSNEEKKITVNYEPK